MFRFFYLGTNQFTKAKIVFFSIQHKRKYIKIRCLDDSCILLDGIVSEKFFFLTFTSFFLKKFCSKTKKT